MQLKDEEKMLLLLKFFQMQNDTQKMTVDNNKKTGGAITNKLFITADLMQFFFDYVAKTGNVVSIFAPVPKIKFKVGEEGVLNDIHFEIINGTEEIYTGLEVYQAYIRSENE